MPHQVEPLDRLEKMLTKKQMDKWLGMLKETPIAVSLPKVSMEISHDLQVNASRVYNRNVSALSSQCFTLSLLIIIIISIPQKHLQELGLTEAVDKSKADLSKISGKKDLYLSSVFHACALEWGTDGNEINTTIFGTDKLRNPKLFYADHPFIFLVKDQKTNSILFIGRMVKPKGEKMRDEL